MLALVLALRDVLTDPVDDGEELGDCEPRADVETEIVGEMGAEKVGVDFVDGERAGTDAFAETVTVSEIEIVRWSIGIEMVEDIVAVTAPDPDAEGHADALDESVWGAALCVTDSLKVGEGLAETEGDGDDRADVETDAVTHAETSADAEGGRDAVVETDTHPDAVAETERRIDADGVAVTARDGEDVVLSVGKAADAEPLRVVEIELLGEPLGRGEPDPLTLTRALAETEMDPESECDGRDDGDAA